MTGPAAQVSLRSQVLSGATWTAIARAGTQFVSFCSITTVAHILHPADYGIVGMAQVVIGFITMSRELGIGMAVIQQREISDDLLSTLFWLACGLGVVASTLCMAAAPLVAAFYGQPVIEPILRVLSLSFLITGIALVQTSLLNRRMQFRSLAMIEIVAAVAGFATALTLAHSGAGAWSLVGASLANTVLTSSLTMYAAMWRPRLKFCWGEVRSLVGFGLNLSGFNIVNYFARNGDNVVVGRYLGAAQLGFYQFAYNLMLYPVQSIAWVLGRALLPALSQMQDDDRRLRHAYIRSCAAIALVTFPVMMILLPQTDTFISVVLGARWQPAASVLAILVPVGMMQSMVTNTGQLFIVKKRTDLLFRVGVVTSTLTLLSFFAGLRWGIQGVAIAYTIVTAMMFVPTLYIAFQLIGLRVQDLWNAVRTQFGASLLACFVVMAVRWQMATPGNSRWTELVLGTVLGSIAYILLLAIARPPIWDELLDMTLKLPLRSLSSSSAQPRSEY